VATTAVQRGVIEVREFLPSDYDAVRLLWRDADGVVLREVDDRDPVTRYLERNPGLSFVACDGAEVIGAVLCGTDGRRGYLQHLAVASTHRRRGVGRTLAERATEALAERGVDKCHLMVLPANAGARTFWQRLGWVERPDIVLMSRTASGRPTA
jgi:ribosomal protein S18 acetylase RimI-like enzyme